MVPVLNMANTLVPSKHVWTNLPRECDAMATTLAKEQRDHLILSTKKLIQCRVQKLCNRRRNLYQNVPLKRSLQSTFRFHTVKSSPVIDGTFGGVGYIYIHNLWPWTKEVEIFKRYCGSNLVCIVCSPRGFKGKGARKKHYRDTQFNQILQFHHGRQRLKDELSTYVPSRH